MPIVCLLSPVCAADEWSLPTVTPQNAQKLADRPAMLSVGVVEVKFAQRRQLHFLSSTKNFRSEENIPIAIRNADLPRFQQAGIKNLSAKYLGQRIRARGTVTRDEGQWLLVVSSPEQIELREGADSGAGSIVLVVVNERGTRTELPTPFPKDLSRHRLEVEHEGQKETYEGVLLADVLARAGVALGAGAREVPPTRYLLVRAQDNYAALFSIPEIDPFFAQRPAILADKLNGASLPANKGQLLVVVPGDKHGRRWVAHVNRLEVRNALDKPPSAN